MAVTKEHVFPGGFFNKPLPTNLPPRIPACFECNNGLSKDEETFRVFLAAERASESESGKRIWDERIRPDLKGKRPGLKRHVKSMVKLARINHAAGDFIGYAHILELDREGVNRVLHKIAKGLYYLDTNKPLSKEVEILAGYGAENPKIFCAPLDDAFKRSKRVELGNGEVTYWRNIIMDNL